MAAWSLRQNTSGCAALLGGGLSARMSGEQIEEARAIKARLRCGWSALSQITGRNEQTLRSALGGPQLYAVPVAVPAPAPVPAPLAKLGADPLRDARRVMARVAARRGLTVEDLVAWDRSPAKVAARHAALYAVRRLIGADGEPRYAFAALAPLFKRHWATLAHALRRGSGDAPVRSMARAEEVVAAVARQHRMTVAELTAPGKGPKARSVARREALLRVRAIVGDDGQPVYSLVSLAPLFGRSATLLGRIAARRPAPCGPPPKRVERYRFRPTPAAQVLARGAPLLTAMAAAQRGGAAFVGPARIGAAVGLAPVSATFALKALAKLPDPLVYKLDDGWRLTTAGWGWIVAHEGGGEGAP